MKSLKIKLELNNKQRTLATKHAGIARYAYNWGKSICDEAIKNKTGRPSSIDLHKKFVAEEKSTKGWIYEVSKCSPQQAFRNLSEAYNRIFKVKGTKFPKFKKKGVYDSFYLEGTMITKENKIKIPKFGWVKCSETLPEYVIKNVVISKTANQWFIAFKIPFEPIKNNSNKTVGVDLGIKTLATLSDGITFDAIKPYRKNKQKLKILQRRLSKKVKGSNNRKKAQIKVARLHYKIVCIRKDATHKLTTYLAKNHSEVVIEDLNVSGMSKNHKLASAILDGGFYEFRRQLGYKSKWYGNTLTIADKWFASSKTCSCCGWKNIALKLSDRTFKCNVCGNTIDRDLNAAKNLEKKAVSYTVSACGVGSSVEAIQHSPTVKQEKNSIVEPLKVQECVSFL